MQILRVRRCVAALSIIGRLDNGVLRGHVSNGFFSFYWRRWRGLEPLICETFAEVCFFRFLPSKFAGSGFFWIRTF